MPIYRVPIVVTAADGGGSSGGGGGRVGDGTTAHHGDQSTSSQPQRPNSIQVLPTRADMTSGVNKNICRCRPKFTLYEKGGTYLPSTVIGKVNASRQHNFSRFPLFI